MLREFIVVDCLNDMNLNRYLELYLKYFFGIRKDNFFGFSLLMFMNIDFLDVVCL